MNRFEQHSQGRAVPSQAAWVGRPNAYRTAPSAAGASAARMPFTRANGASGVRTGQRAMPAAAGGAPLRGSQRMAFAGGPQPPRPPQPAPVSPTPHMPSSARAPKQKSKAPKIVAIILAVLVAIYVVGIVVFSNIFYPHTTFAGKDISLQGPQAMASLADDLADSYTLAVSGDDLDFTLTSQQIGLKVDGNAEAKKALEANQAWQWPVQVFLQHDESTVLDNDYDKDKVSQLVGEQVDQYNKKATDPVNATIGYDDASGSFKVVPEQPGTKIDGDAAVSAVDTALGGMLSQVKLSDAQLVQPTVLSTEPGLASAAEQANGFLGADVELVLGSSAIHAGEVGPSQIAKFVTVGDDYTATLDESAIDSWVSDFVDTVNTVGTTRQYQTVNDGVIGVSGGTYGWKVDKDQFASDLKDAINNHTQGQLKVATTSEGYTWKGVGQPDWGAHAEVDISAQHAWFFDVDGNLVWESDIVSGKPGHDTTRGIFRIFKKQSPGTLTGKIDPATGKPEYVTQVQYWMQFTTDGIGFHDASWQAAFGGTRYQQGYGSHGCCNLPPAKAAALYDLIQIGNAVIVHD